ncbi:MAG: ABC transporter ATP-binding protein [Clostridia bacterium]|nr:ABC transporter ATP-binding protein [Clostridia bacterium]
MKVNKTAGKWLMQHTRRQLPSVILLSVLSALTSAAYLWLALLSKELIEAAQQLLESGKSLTLWNCLADPALYIPAATAVAVVLGQVILHMLTSRLRVHVSGKLEMRLREQVFSSLLHTEYTAINAFHSGELITRLTSDVTVVAQGVTGLAPTAISLLTKLVGSMAVLAVLAPELAVVIAAIGVLAVIGSRFYGSKLKKLHKRCQEAYGKTRSFIQEAFTQLLSVKAFADETAVENEMNACQNEHFRFKLRRNTVQIVGSTGMYLLMTAAYYAMLLWCVFCLAIGTMTVGTLTALLQVFEQLQSPLRSASGIMPQYYAMMASAERLQQADTMPPETDNTLPASRRTVVDGFRSLVMAGVSFAYDEDTPVLQQVDLTVNRGECVALVGASGIGKSTLMKLLLAIHSCDAGSISLEGEVSVPVSAATRCIMAYVPQGNALISGTIRDNITFFREVSTEAVEAAVRLACLDEFVGSLPEGLDTVLGEHGLGVSEGQAQRIAVARALLHDAPILLLDECTSALDAETEERLLKNLRSLNDKAVLLISHKDTTVAGSDRVLRLENGKLTAL